MGRVLRAGAWLAAACWCCLSGCERRPFEAEYLSADTVAVTYQGRRHLLLRRGPPAQVPFAYSFEADGDLDLIIGGRAYEVDSPYDVDGSRKKKKKAGKTGSFWSGGAAKTKPAAGRSPSGRSSSKSRSRR